MKTLFEQFKKPVLFHTVFYQGKDGPSPTGYLSTDPDVISRQLAAMQLLGGEGAGLIALSYGLVSPFIAQAVAEACKQANALGMPFGLCFDPWTVKAAATQAAKDAAMIATIKNPAIQAILNSKTYLPGKPILDFSTGVNPAAIRAANLGVEYWMNGVDYGWLYIDPANPNSGSPAFTVAATKRVNALPTMKLPFVGMQFNDGTGANRNMSVWDQSKPARIVPANGGDLFHDMAALIPASAKYVQVGPWNDALEGTDIEKIAAFIGAAKIGGT